MSEEFKSEEEVKEKEEESKEKVTENRDIIKIGWFSMINNPKDFFGKIKESGKLKYLFIIIWMIGMNGVIDRLEQNMFKSQYGGRSLTGIDIFTENWIYFWMLVGIMGILRGAMQYYIGGWWYNVRIKWSGAEEHDRELGRVIYCYNKAIAVIPVVILTIIYTVLFDNYKTAYNEENALEAGLILFVIFSIINSYRSVRAVFELKGFKAILWFLILPLILMIAAIGIIMVIILMKEFIV